MDSVRQVNLHAAKTYLSPLVGDVVAGAGFVICKAALRRDGFQVEPSDVRRVLPDAGFLEIPIAADHVLAVGGAPFASAPRLL